MTALLTILLLLGVCIEGVTIMDGDIKSMLSKKFQQKPDFDRFIRANKQLNSMKKHPQSHVNENKDSVKAHDRKLNNIDAENICRNSRCGDNCDDWPSCGYVLVKFRIFDNILRCIALH